MITLHGIEIKVGDKVWDCGRGWTKVILVDTGVIYPIITTESRFTNEGFANSEHKFPRLFWQAFEIPAHAFKKPKVMVKKYLVLYKYDSGRYHTTSSWEGYHLNEKDFCKKYPKLKFISLILESEIEVEE